MDCLHIRGIRGYGYVGYLPEEQVLGQWFEVDLTLWLDLSAAGRSDRLEDTHDYSQTVGQVQQLMQTSRFKLIESLAEAIASMILNTGIEQVRVMLTKLTPPVPQFDGQIVVDITRSAVGWDTR
jgi:7,8-dihydroneopterin aldolase/epimerase/oxygenase